MILFNNGMISASILSQIKDWFVSLLTHSFFIEVGAWLWNTTISVIYTMLGANPTSGTYAEAWKIVKGLYTTFEAVGAALLVVFFIYGYCRDTLDIRSELTLEGTVKIFIRFIVTINILTYAIDWMPKLFSYAIALLGVTEEASVTIDADLVIAEIGGTGFGIVTIYLLSFLWFLVAAVCSIAMIIICIGRFLKLYTIIPFASIALSTIAGGGQLSQTGYAYIKTFLTYTFEIVVIGVVLAVSGSFVFGNSFFDSGTDSSILVMTESIIKMVAVTTAMKGSEAALRKMFNF